MEAVRGRRMYIAVHFGVPILLAAVLTVFLCRHKQIKMQWRVLAVAAMVLLFSLLQQFPPENLFMQFDTPEEAFRYTSSRKVLETVENSESCMVLYEGRGDEPVSWCALQKSENGWKLPTTNHIQVQESGRVDADALPVFCGSCQYTVMRYHDTDDYYLYIAVYVDKGKTEFADDRNGPVSCILTSNDYGSYVTICVPFDGYPTDYTLTVDGETVLRLE